MMASKYLRFIVPVLPVAIGAMALIGWSFHIDIFKRGLAFGVAMNPATAIGFMLLGLEACRRQARAMPPDGLGRMALWLVCAASAAKLLDLLLHTSFGIDQIFFSSLLDLEPDHPSRMAPNTALCFMLISAAMLFMRRGTESAIRIAQALMLVPALFALLAVSGYAYGTQSFYGIGSYIPMAFNTALAFASLVVALLLDAPDRGYLKFFTSGGPAGKIAAMLLPAVLVVPFLVGWATLYALNAGQLDQALAHAILVAANVAIFFVLSYVSIRSLFYSDLERQQAEAIREEESKYRVLFDTFSDGIFLQDGAGVLIDCNEKGASLCGLSRWQVVGMKTCELLPAGQPSNELVCARFDQARQGAPQQFECQFQRAGQGPFDAEVTLSPVEYRGAPCLQLVLRDITERKRTDEVMKLNRMIIKTAQEGFWRADLQGRLIEVNQAYADVIGYTREELVGMHISRISLCNDTPEKVRAMIARIVESGHVSFETQHRRKDGGVVDFETSVTYSEEDRALFGFLHDITERKLAEQRLQDQQARVNGLIDAAMDAIVSTDEQQHILIFNHGAEQMFGYRAADMIGKSVELLMPERYRENHAALVDEFGRTGITTRSMSQPGQSYGLRANGEEFPFEASISRVSVAGGIVYTAILRDTTLRKQVETELRIAAAAFESQEGMLITDAKGVILRVNKAFTETTGYTAEEVIGQTPRLLKSGRHEPDFYRAMWETINRTGSWQGEVWDRKKSGEIYPKWLTISAVKGEDGEITHYVGSHVDITERKAAEDEVRSLAFYDPLTRLPNRRLLLDRLDHALASSGRSGREGALLFIDLDNFKTLNDTLGHDFGDLLLQQVAARLQGCVREGDTVARLGGDEFVVMLEDLSAEAAAAAAQTEAIGEKILVSLNRPYQLDTHEYRSTPSIGATLFNDHEKAIDELLKQADIAMYQSKKAGRNTLRFFDPMMQDSVNVRAALEGELRKALENRQFHLYYQVQVDDEHRALGAEALIRWIHPEYGLVSPASFIPLAEETGLILPIGQWVLESACAQLAVWRNSARTRELVLAVNVSSKQFRQADFVSQVQDAVSRHGINPARLKLELTESLLLDDVEHTVAIMSTLKQTGVMFSLDDFGTGYSSLQYLKRLSIDQIKIDQSFVRDLATDSSDRAIVRTIISMAEGLNMAVIAEGVETEDQRQFLRNAGCFQYQGYLFGKPVPIDQFEAKLGPD